MGLLDWGWRRSPKLLSAKITPTKHGWSTDHFLQASRALAVLAESSSNIICVVYLKYTFCRVGAVQGAWRLKKILPFAVSLCLVTCCDNWHGTRIVVIVATAAMQHWSMNMFFRTCLSLVRAVNSSKWIVLARCHSGVSYSFAAVFSAPEMSTSVIPQAKPLASP